MARNISLLSMFLISTLLVMSLTIQSKGTLIYHALFIMGVTSLIYFSRNFESRKALLFVIVYHIILIYTPMLGVRITERNSAMVALITNGLWDENWGYLNPVYNPFPADIGLFGILSIITSLPIISELIFLGILASLIISFDLAIYRLVEHLTGHRIAGILAVLILALTPPTNFTMHLPKWIAVLLVLISTLMLIKALNRFSPATCLLASIACFASSLFFHPSAVIGVLVPISIVLVAYATRERRFNTKSLGNLFILFIVLLIAKNMFAAGSLEALIPFLKDFILTAIGYEWLPESTPRYELDVSPIHAHSWSTPVAAASALAFYILLKSHMRRQNVSLLLALYMVGALFAGLGFLGGLTGSNIRGPAFASFVFFALVAGVTSAKILKSRNIFAILFIALILTNTYVALTDPSLNLNEWKKLRGSAFSASIEDYEESIFLFTVIPFEKVLFAPFEVASCFSYISVAKGVPQHHFFEPNMPGHRHVIDRLLNESELVPKTIYIWPERWHSNIASYLDEVDLEVNIYYNGGRYLVFEAKK